MSFSVGEPGIAQQEKSNDDQRRQIFRPRSNAVNIKARKRGDHSSTGADLFWVTAVQIALAAKAMDGEVLCVACGKAYQRKRLVIRRGFN